ncbi:hypothetical protein [uncultured Gammaproteobacteria bacterium]|jgi:predicted transcriptional regulator|uniref:Uncharacterized protein n=2 Tax=sulfur-oxidizing symbionts TaxID=32036 RepID=A0ACA8ZSH5_9GAMM|nr:hypothetical protein [Bathymodiolus thermophilus thioautotrophic gill symbiont]CAB5504932.1 hypothetical protein AZO1586R_1832 [Bathymodiolus azoricus thioautotrophic gill symbiont]CAC9487444.1 hypothetical protein [uncultured Gammaproteobacteria bacterium]CAB5508437.1 hypothetical protein AZO1586I_2712 [Bathymodiolus thermophilus thioautotrophic gill symbiont]CAC9507939.1 hypothetical protein [uncultured Gammaproteobacteria bacterium]CAC9515142.1 hypothetical protein [uncultured Gammaprote
MIDVGSQFAKKISTIMIVENLTLKQFSQRVDIPYNRCHDYKTRRKSNPSINNVFKVINAFPIYTCYIMNLDPTQLHDQIILKEKL